MLEKVSIVGGGLAGVEAAWQCAKRGIKVDLYEMRPIVFTSAHLTDKLGELVCSNSLRAISIENAIGLLKKEMEMLDSLIMKAAVYAQIEAGGAFGVDREKFSSYITDVISNTKNIDIIRKEVKEEIEGYVIYATGPLTSFDLSEVFKKKYGDDNLYFYDSIAPTIDASSINFEKVYLKSRYDKGKAVYLNCPMDKKEYQDFFDYLIKAEKTIPHIDEDLLVFEGCMAIEDMAMRGEKTLLFGPLKPVGLKDENSNKIPYAVVQLRPENSEKTMYNLVGFQTHLRRSEQEKLIKLIPGLENAIILRYGSMHRNTYINSPKILNHYYQTRTNDKIFFAGQITGVEGYIESASSGLVAGINMTRLIKKQELIDFTKNTAIGSLAHYIETINKKFQPMNVNFGLFKEIYKNKSNYAIISERTIKEVYHE
jgi:methylenetetrahydrofolate--tRNA-(uracil-5-)-methyltransferase